MLVFLAAFRYSLSALKIYSARYIYQIFLIMTVNIEMQFLFDYLHFSKLLEILLSVF